MDIPLWLAGIIVLATFAVAWKWPSTRRAMAAVRSAVGVRFPRLRFPKLTVVPQPLDPERPEDYAGAVAVDANGTPVGNGPPPENESGSGG